MADTKIEWTDKSWNPVTGCSKISEGCQNCYAERMAKRLAGRYGYPKDEPFRVTWHPTRLQEPFLWRNPRRIFVCSMGDLFHSHVTKFAKLAVMSTIFGCPRHIFIVLTKRPQIMKALFDYHSVPANAWLGVSVENQKTADERIPILLQIPAKVRFVSIEPMLGPVDLYSYFWHWREKPNWIIVGGETGPKARVMYPDWAISVKNQCQKAGVPFFFKRWGDCPYPHYTEIGDWIDAGYDPYVKKAGGRFLDGQIWEEWPER